ncbi:MAG: NAD(P)H-nitrite reductase [Candidatus Methanofastidiosa archaeon]|nr:NAD(P)H-nitrite reductase [Candidatus Methanofastidiosa archaeon]NYT13771.1 NAD(P)H-nitrite reductase [Candidatus Methanofastidiosa archaeon]
MNEDEMVCYCKKVRRSEIVEAIKNGAKSFSDIQKMTDACTGDQCETLNPKGRCCSVEIFGILAEFYGDIGSCPCCGR